MSRGEGVMNLPFDFLWRRRDSNSQPQAYETSVLSQLNYHAVVKELVGRLRLELRNLLCIRQVLSTN